jgi:hypothetical protein
MKMMRKSWICLVFILLSTPIISSQDLSRYRKFSLGTSLTALSKQIGQDPHRANLIQQRPAVIQELTYWPVDTPYSSVQVQPVSRILFSFYNGELYRMVVSYEQNAIQGLTEDDMVRAISARYGNATRFYPEINLPTKDVYASAETIIARWADSGSSIDLFHSSTLNSFGLAVFSKRLDVQAEAAIAESLKRNKQEAPQKEIDLRKSEADRMEIVRQKNIKTFRP